MVSIEYFISRFLRLPSRLIVVALGRGDWLVRVADHRPGGGDRRPGSAIAAADPWPVLTVMRRSGHNGMLTSRRWLRETVFGQAALVAHQDARTRATREHRG
jgi:hypothetical protein